MARVIGIGIGIVLFLGLVALGPLGFVAVELIGNSSTESFIVDLDRQPDTLTINLPPTEGGIMVTFANHVGVDIGSGLHEGPPGSFTRNKCSSNCPVVFELSPAFDRNNKMTVHYLAADSEYLDNIDLQFSYP